MTDLDTLYVREVAKAYEQPPETPMRGVVIGLIFGACVWALGYVGWRVARMIW